MNPQIDSLQKENHFVTKHKSFFSIVVILFIGIFLVLGYAILHVQTTSTVPTISKAVPQMKLPSPTPSKDDGFVLQNQEKFEKTVSQKEDCRHIGGVTAYSDRQSQTGILINDLHTVGEDMQNKRSRFISFLNQEKTTPFEDLEFLVDPFHSWCAGSFHYFVKEFTDITYPNTDKSRVFMILTGQNDPGLAGVMIVAQKGNNLLLITEDITKSLDELSGKEQCNVYTANGIVTDEKNYNDCYRNLYLHSANIEQQARLKAQSLITLFAINSNNYTTNPITQTKGLKRYADGGRVAFLYPKEWKITRQPQNRGNKFVAEFEMNSTVVLTVSEFTEDIDFNSYLGTSAKTIMINGYKAKRLHDNGIAGHRVPSETVAFFPEGAGIIEFYFKSPDSTVDFDTAVSRWFDPLLFTVKASAMPGPDVEVNKSIQQIYRDAHPKQIVTITSQPFQDTSLLKSYTDRPLALTLMYPQTWKLGQAAGTDSYTLTLTSTDPDANFGIGDQEYFSRSGTICPNASFCENVGTFTVTIEGKQYNSSIYEVGSVLDDLTDNPKTQFSGYKFQIILNEVKAISGQFKTIPEGQEIANIVSTIKH